MRFFLQTFGCKSNQYESQAMREALLADGFEEVHDPQSADLLITNTCAVTGRAGASCRNAIRKAVRANPGIIPIITGCAVDLDEAWTTELSKDGLRVRNAAKHGIAAAARALAEERPLPPPESDRFALKISSFHGHTRAFLKVQDGCDNFCTYCAVPYARGAPESRDPESVFEEAARLIGNEYRELVLTGINIGAYRRGGIGLADLSLRIADTPGLARLRLGSVEPTYVDDRLLDAIASHDAICRHIHLPLQSGNDLVLKAMGRRYTADSFLRLVEKIRARVPLPSITTDVIVGFPGEDETAFLNTQSLCREAGFSRLHVFLFSPRPGTPAASMRQTASNREIESRRRRLIDFGDELAECYAASLVGLEERIVVEKNGEGLCDRYLRTSVPGNGLPINSVQKIRIIAASGAHLAAESIPTFVERPFP
ncbi:MAG: tRNA (N(6)-L-threonylcarbamoyladenosine(37)-C(2))-methylthiotransferase MtaB [Planctomycetota bacterium]|jgi:threonylcarbamoyladenosine tRNA methylthiotransferase MtaB|nr:tRNA (N(6)-L-threonylcarbamoyladenosine(37)-C(2))-methylthiotransferase MtaB [Planctomycetota bacterium]